MKVGLAKGARGAEVAHLQKYLNRFGYLPQDRVRGPASARFDDPTDGALKRYQRFYRLDETGVVDEPTAELMSQPRCAVPDRLQPGPRAAEPVAFTPGTHWDWSDLDLTYGISAHVAELTGDQVRSAIGSAFQRWRTAANNRLLFTLVSHTVADIAIGVDPVNDTGSLAYAYYPPNGDIYFHDDPWNWGLSPNVGPGSNDFCFTQVALHEIGHALGLGHTSVAEAVMYAYINPGNQSNTLHSDDIAGIQYQYPSTLPTLPPPPPPDPPDAPSGISASVRSAGLLLITWSAAPRATRHEVEVNSGYVVPPPRWEIHTSGPRWEIPAPGILISAMAIPTGDPRFAGQGITECTVSVRASNETGSSPWTTATVSFDRPVCNF